MDSRLESEVGVEGARELATPPFSLLLLMAVVDGCCCCSNSLLRSPGIFSFASVLLPLPTAQSASASFLCLMLLRLLRQHSQTMTMSRMSRITPMPAAMPMRISVVRNSVDRVESAGAEVLLLLSPMAEEDKDDTDDVLGDSELVLDRKYIGKLNYIRYNSRTLYNVNANRNKSEHLSFKKG